MLCAFIVAAIAYLLIAAGVEAGGGDVRGRPPAALIIAATIVQDLALIAAALVFASMWARGLTPATFGLRPVRLGPAVGWTLLTLRAFWSLTAIYISAVGEPDQQELTRDLREEESLAALIGYGVLLAFVAPLTEEMFFRGFVFGVLREKAGVIGGALATGVVFGLVHVSGSPIETVGVLVILGVLLCLLYAQTGSLLPCIALHAINNAISFARHEGDPGGGGVLIVLAAPAASVAVGALRHAAGAGTPRGSADSAMSRCSTRGIPPSAWAARMRSAPLPSRRIRSTSSSAASARACRRARARRPRAIRSRTGRSAPSCQTAASSPSRPARKDDSTSTSRGERLSARRLVRGGEREPVDERGEPADGAEPGLRVHRPDLERAELRVRAQVPPEERVVLDPGGGDHRLDRARVVLPAGERARDVGARVAAEHLRPRGLEAGVDAVPVGRVGGERLQHRQVLAHAVEGADRGLGVGHADVDVQRAGRRAPQQPAHLAADRRGSARRRRAARRRTGSRGGCRRRPACRPRRGSPPAAPPARARPRSRPARSAWRSRRAPRRRRA